MSIYCEHDNSDVLLCPTCLQGALNAAGGELSRLRAENVELRGEVERLRAMTEQPCAWCMEDGSGQLEAELRTACAEVERLTARNLGLMALLKSTEEGGERLKRKVAARINRNHELFDAAKKIEAERDAALATIEKGREWTSDPSAVHFATEKGCMELLAILNPPTGEKEMEEKKGRICYDDGDCEFPSIRCNNKCPNSPE